MKRLFTFWTVVLFVIHLVGCGEDYDSHLPADFIARAGQNYPNPFNAETWLPYELAFDSVVTLSIRDSTGKMIRTIFVGFKPVGIYETQDDAIRWDGRDNKGERVASGLYFYTFQSNNNFVVTGRMEIIK